MDNSSNSSDMNRYDPYSADVSWVAGGTVDYRSWLLRVVGWDGVLPIVILSVPQVALSLGAEHSVTEALAITMPILAFFVRIVVGRQHIATNHCGTLVRCCQFVVFFMAAIHLVCIDALMLVSMEMNNGRLWANQADFLVWVVLLSVYFIAMLFVMYPGRTAQPASALAVTEAT